ncbi:MAG: class I SAM-dependent methyltransferase [Planctomycetota bacterium]
MDQQNDTGHYDIISDPAKRLEHEGDFLLWLLSIAPKHGDVTRSPSPAADVPPEAAGPPDSAPENRDWLRAQSAGRRMPVPDLPRNARPPAPVPVRVLDMATATGVHAFFLAENGAEVTARDLKEESIDYARAHRSHPRISYEVHDLREARGGPFDLVVVMGNTLCLLESAADVEKGLAAARQSLAPGGVLFAHVVNYAAVEATGPRQKVRRLSTQGVDKIIVKDMVPTGENAPVLVAFSHFEFKDGAWRTWGSQAVLLNLRRENLGAMIEAAGFEIEGIFGDYDRSAFEEKRSPDLLFVARKPASG